VGQAAMDHAHLLVTEFQVLAILAVAVAVVLELAIHRHLRLLRAEQAVQV